MDETGEERPKRLPLVLLKEHCGNLKAQLILKRTEWDIGRRCFVTEIEVNSKMGTKFKANGFGRSPEGAKDSAARGALKLICPLVDQILTPPSKFELVGAVLPKPAVIPSRPGPPKPAVIPSRPCPPKPAVIPSRPVLPKPAVTPTLGLSGTRKMPKCHEDDQFESMKLVKWPKGGEVMIFGDGGAVRGAVGGGASVGGGDPAGVLETQGTPGSSGQFPVTTQENEGIVTVTVKVPDHRLSLKEKTEVVKNWSGEKTAIFKRFRMERILEMKREAMVFANGIRREQNLEMEHEVFTEKSDDGSTSFSYLLEVFPGEDKGDGSRNSDVRQPEGLYFMEMGRGGNAEKAEIVAVRKFLLTVRSMLNS